MAIKTLIAPTRITNWNTAANDPVVISIAAPRSFADTPMVSTLMGSRSKKIKNAFIHNPRSHASGRTDPKIIITGAMATAMMITTSRAKKEISTDPIKARMKTKTKMLMIMVKTGAFCTAIAGLMIMPAKTLAVISIRSASLIARVKDLTRPIACSINQYDARAMPIETTNSVTASKVFAYPVTEYRPFFIDAQMVRAAVSGSRAKATFLSWIHEESRISLSFSVSKTISEISLPIW